MLKVEQKGTRKAAYDLKQLGARANDTRDASYKVRTVFRKSEEARFNRQGPGWPPLAATTRERKSREHLDPRTMRAKQVLYRSLTSPRAALQVDRRDPHEMEFGTEVPYARFHQEGRGVPGRKLIDLTVSEQREMRQVISAYVARGET